MGALTAFLNIVIPGSGWALGKLFSRPWVYLWVGALMLWYGHHWVGKQRTVAYDKGRAEVTAQYEARLKVEQYRAAQVLAQEQLAQQTIVTDLTSKLETANNRASQIHYLTKDVIRYVTKKADANCTVPAGFVSLYNLSASPGSPGDDGMAASVPADADASTGLALSAVAAIAAGNNAECVVRGEVIEAWQGWYAKNKALYEHSVAVQKKPLPTTSP